MGQQSLGSMVEAQPMIRKTENVRQATKMETSSATQPQPEAVVAACRHQPISAKQPDYDYYYYFYLPWFSNCYLINKNTNRLAF